MIAPSMPPEAGRAASSLLTVALLSESLGDEASDARTAVWSEQVRRIALRGLGAEPSGDAERLQVQLEIRAERDHADEALADATKADASPRGTATEPDGTDVTGAPGGAHEPNDPGEPPSELTDREREIVRLLRTGASNAAIARDLYLSEATIKGHVSRLMRRHDCGNRTQLALLATRWSL
ncbi:MAG TPA: LuxR C-terminal-related transcriptional regulator [Candidatus Brachybacterium merdavium]|uniref:LuxR C-terminal-related transcriptional regulator n=1 Tax=Candidatus Brachybacterium merdavium TaxID=2838513 RepID=A0A9D2RPG9_9MICO|nr:LuxR C-terminal-related transcriptional regulator [Candidatus Brachybacterium merdavium]